MPPLKDLTGQKFGHLTVIERAPNKGKFVTWKCQCDCGKIIDVRGNNLTRTDYKTVSCGCKNGLYLPGMTFGDLLVLEEINNPTSREYKCKCTCGNEVIFSRTQLTSGVVHYCGIKKNHIARTNFNDLSGQRFGALVAIQPSQERTDGKVMWECQCDCGAITWVMSSNLVSGNTTSCGCSKSKGELKCSTILTDNHIPFIVQHSFDNCVFPNSGRKAKFDFWINNTYIVEYDGIQHFQQGGWNDDNSLEKNQYRDAYKNQWCKDNNIPLIRIPYTKLDTLCIEDLLLETTKFRMV